MVSYSKTPKYYHLPRHKPIYFSLWQKRNKLHCQLIYSRNETMTNYASPLGTAVSFRRGQVFPSTPFVCPTVVIAYTLCMARTTNRRSHWYFDIKLIEFYSAQVWFGAQQIEMSACFWKYKFVDVFNGVLGL